MDFSCNTETYCEESVPDDPASPPTGMTTSEPQQGAAEHEWPETWTLGVKFGKLSAQMAFAEAQGFLLRHQRRHAQAHEANCLVDNSNQVDLQHKIRLAEIFQQHCPRILAELRSQPFSAPFNSTVNALQFQDYHTIVLNPCDLLIVSQRCNVVGHYAEPAAFLRDVQLVIDNALLYHAPGTDTFAQARSLHDHLSALWNREVADKLLSAVKAMEDHQKQLKDVFSQRRRERSECQGRLIGKSTDMMRELTFEFTEAKVAAESVCTVMSKEELTELACELQTISRTQMHTVMVLIWQHAQGMERPICPNPDSSNHHTDPQIQPQAAPPDLGGCNKVLQRMVQYFVSLCISLEDEACLAARQAAEELAKPEPLWTSSGKPRPKMHGASDQNLGNQAGITYGGQHPQKNGVSGGVGNSSQQINPTHRKWGSSRSRAWQERKNHPRPPPPPRDIPWSILPGVHTTAEVPGPNSDKSTPATSMRGLLDACAGMERLSMRNRPDTLPEAQPPVAQSSSVSLDELDLSLFSGLTLGPQNPSRSISDPADTSSTSTFVTPPAARAPKRQLVASEDNLGNAFSDMSLGAARSDSEPKRAHLPIPDMATPNLAKYAAIATTQA